MWARVNTREEEEKEKEEEVWALVNSINIQTDRKNTMHVSSSSYICMYPPPHTYACILFLIHIQTDRKNTMKLQRVDNLKP